jgi:phage tail-like protein
MAVPRNDPYGAFNFLVTAERFGAAGTVQGGFQEVSGLSTEVTVAEYRNGNEIENHVRKIPGIYKAGDVTLKRGVIGAEAFSQWIRAVRDGEQNVRATVTIELFDEAHEGPVMTWVLSNAFPNKYTGPTLNAKGGTDVAMEELVLVCEKLDVS